MKKCSRKTKRMYLVFYLRVFEAGEFIGFVMDISKKGIMVISEKPMIPGRIYDLKMNLPPDINRDNSPDSAEFIAYCRWSRPDEENVSFFLNGFEIENMNGRDSALIEKTIKAYRLN